MLPWLGDFNPAPAIGAIIVLAFWPLKGLDPETYLSNIIDRIAKGHPANKVCEFPQWNWTRQAVRLAA